MAQDPAMDIALITSHFLVGREGVLNSVRNFCILTAIGYTDEITRMAEAREDR
jgi:hypothetical protein